MLEFTFEHKHCGSLRKGKGENIAEAYKDAGISAEGREVWRPVDIIKFN